MPFNVAGAMQYARPVDSMYEGRALRQAEQIDAQNLRLGAQTEEMNALKLDAAKNPQLSPEETRAAESHQIKRAQDFMTAGRDLHAQTYALYDSLVKSGSSKEDAQVAAQAVWDKNRRMVAETFGKDFAVQLDDDGKWTPEESLAGMQQADEMLKQLQGGGEGGSKFGVTPQFGVDAQNNPVPIQFNDKGEAVVSKMPDGVTISRNPIRLDAGTEWLILDPVTRAVVSRQPKNVGEAETEKKTGEWYGKAYTDLQEAGLKARGTISRLADLENLAQNVESGRLGNVRKAISEWATEFGIDVEGLDDTQAFQALSNRMALDVRNTAEGGGMPGAMSDADREFLLRTIPNLQNTPGGNVKLIGYLRRIAQGQIEAAKFARDYERRNGSIDSRFLDELEDWRAGKPLFDQQQESAESAGGETYAEGDVVVNPNTNERLVLRNNQWVKE